MSPNKNEDAERVSFTELMALERIDASTFRSIARPYAPGNGNRAFGGHVYAQAVYAAAQTVADGFLVHNVTGLFILPGLLDVPFQYAIVLIRDGGSYCTRSVTVTQGPSPSSNPPSASSSSSSSSSSSAPPICFTALISFKRNEPSPYTHQTPTDPTKKYALALRGKSPSDHPLAPAADSPLGERLPSSFPGLEIRKVDMAPYNDATNTPTPTPAADDDDDDAAPAARHPSAYRQLQYYRVIGRIAPEDVNLHACAHLYASDRNSMFLVTRALGIGDGFGRMASLSHSVVLHVGGEGLRMVGGDGEGRWFVQEAWSGRSGGGRGLHCSRLWDLEGVHVGSTLQDGMVRLKRGGKI